MIEGVQSHYIKLECSSIENIIIDRPKPTEAHPEGMCFDNEYNYDEVYAILRDFGFRAQVRLRGVGVQVIKLEVGFKAHHWVVKRVHSWLNRFRGLLVR